MKQGPVKFIFNEVEGACIAQRVSSLRGMNAMNGFNDCQELMVFMLVEVFLLSKTNMLIILRQGFLSL
jgi:hypothetical protein